MRRVQLLRHGNERALGERCWPPSGMQRPGCRSAPLGPIRARLMRTCTRRSGSELIDKVGDEAGPTGLMRGAASAAIIAVEVFMKKDVILELRIGLKLLVISENRASAVGTAQKEAQQAPAQLVGDLVQSHHLA